MPTAKLSKRLRYTRLTPAGATWHHAGTRRAQSAPTTKSRRQPTPAPHTKCSRCGYLAPPRTSLHHAGTRPGRNLTETSTCACCTRLAPPRTTLALSTIAAQWVIWAHQALPSSQPLPEATFNNYLNCARLAPPNANLHSEIAPATPGSDPSSQPNTSSALPRVRQALAPSPHETQ